MLFDHFRKVKMILILCILSSLYLHGQSFETSRFGGSIGVSINLGSHVRNVGLNFQAYYTDYFYQVNIGNTLTWNSLSYGNRRRYIENRAALGLVLLAGKRETIADFDLDGLNHQTSYNYGVSYNYLVYTDNIGTSQLSGGWGLHLKEFSVRFENDVFGGQARDRFRTGHLMASYHTEHFKFNAGLYIWTGETKGSTWVREPGEKMPGGYRSLEALPYGKTSHGVLYGGMQVRMPYGNIAYLKVGDDSEHIRHAFQNRFTHDLILLPKSVERKTPHYPRLDENGSPVFEKSKVRRDRFFLQFGMNE